MPPEIKKLNSVLIGEPTMRPDGVTITTRHVTSSDGSRDYRFSVVGPMGRGEVLFYPEGQLTFLGRGDAVKIVGTIGQLLFEAPTDLLGNPDTRLTTFINEKLKERGYGKR